MIFVLAQVTSEPASQFLAELILRKENSQDISATAEGCRQRFYTFVQEFWYEVTNDDPVWNWHIEYLCDELQKVVERVSKGLPKEYDLIINIPPGTTKSTIVSIMLPVWCWINWSWMRFICASYGAILSLEHAEHSRDIVRCEKFNRLFPELEIKADKDTKGNFRIMEYLPGNNGESTYRIGGNRFSTSVGGALTGFHGHVNIVDDPIDPNDVISETKCKTTNNWIDQVLSTRKIDKAVTPTIMIMQRVHQNDPTGHWLAKNKKNVKHICLPGEIINYKKFVSPIELILKYEDGLLDPVRLPLNVLKEMEIDLGQYGYAGQVGQTPTPPSGGMFQVDRFVVTNEDHRSAAVAMWRYWDKAASKDEGKRKAKARTAGVLMYKLKNGKYLIADGKAGKWETDVREDVIRDTAESDGRKVRVAVEQEPGSGGKDSARGTIKNLAGFSAKADRPTGDKVYRADPYSVQVNHGNVMLQAGEWNHDFIEEHRYFPYGTTKDYVDASSGAFNMIEGKRRARMLTRQKRRK